MGDVIQVDVEFLERMSGELHIAAQELAEHASRFSARCGTIGDAYGNLPQSQDAARTYLTVVDSMADHLDQRVAELHAHADALAMAATHYRAGQEAALDAAAGWAAAGLAPGRI
ncbi:hypothetical protein ACWD7F_38585 [Streptomyces sp. NPDC005122]